MTEFYHADRYGTLVEGDLLRGRNEEQSRCLVESASLGAVSYVSSKESAEAWARHLGASRVVIVEVPDKALVEIHFDGWWTVEGPGPEESKWVVETAVNAAEILAVMASDPEWQGVALEVRVFGPVTVTGVQ